MVLIGCFLRQWSTGTVNFFMPNYFKVYSENYADFVNLTATASFVGGLVSTLLTGVAIDFFNKRSEMTIPMIIMCKALVDIPFLIMTYNQQDSFVFSILGVYGEYFLAKGWTSAAILVLKTVVDPSI